MVREGDISCADRIFFGVAESTCDLLPGGGGKLVKPVKEPLLAFPQCFDAVDIATAQATFLVRPPGESVCYHGNGDGAKPVVS